MYGFNRIVDGFRKTSQYQKWAAYYELVSSLKRTIGFSRNIWKLRKDKFTGRVHLYMGDDPERHQWTFCEHCGIPIGDGQPMGYGRYQKFKDKCLCMNCYAGYMGIRPTLEYDMPKMERCPVPTYDFKDWPTFLKDNPLDEGCRWVLYGMDLVMMKGDERRAIWHVRHPMVMRKLISAGLTPP